MTFLEKIDAAVNLEKDVQCAQKKWFLNCIDNLMQMVHSNLIVTRPYTCAFAIQGKGPKGITPTAIEAMCRDGQFWLSSCDSKIETFDSERSFTEALVIAIAKLVVRVR